MKAPTADAPMVFARRTRSLKPSAIREILKTTESPDVISFAGGLPAPELFPVLDLARSTSAVLGADGPSALQYGVTEGFYPLREWVCDYLAETVSLHCEPQRVLITSGSQQGLDLLGKVMIDAGDIILVENPGYLGALQAFQAYEPRIVGIPSDDEGMSVNALREFLHLTEHRPKFLYLVPNFQNPTGSSMSDARRRSIANIAAEFNLLIIEDDPYGSLRYSGQASPSFGAIASAPHVYLGTCSKILAPGLRVAWMAISDPQLFEKLVTAKQAADLHTSSLNQRIVADYVCQSEKLEAHVTRLRQVYCQRRDVMLQQLKARMPEGCSWTHPDGGLFLWMTLPESVDTMDLLKAAAKQKVAFVPGAPFWVNRAVRNTLRLNFSNASESRIKEGIARLSDVIREALANTHAIGRPE